MKNTTNHSSFFLYLISYHFMHSLSCFFLLHHHFEAVTISSDSISTSSGSLNDVIMSDESDHEDKPIETSETVIIPPQSDDLQPDSTLNPDDEESQFIYDDDSNRLICIGSNFNDVPQSIIDSFSHKTKVRKKTGNFIIYFLIFI